MTGVDARREDAVDELREADLLAHGELVPAGERAPDGGLAAAPIPVRCGRPLLYPVPVGDLPVYLRRRAEATGGSYVGALFAFDLDALPRGQRYTAAWFEVTLADLRALAARLDGDGGALGLTYLADDAEPASATAAHVVAATRTRPGWLRRLASRAGTPRAHVFGIHRHEFGWAYEDPRGELLVPRAHGMHALLELPAGTTRVAGTLDVRVRVAGGRERYGAGLRESVRFDETLSPGCPVDGAAVRLCMAADVSGYSRRSTTAAEQVQRDLVALLSRVRRAAGVPDSDVAPQPQGDGQFTVLPVGIDEAVVISRLVRGLERHLRELNTGRAPADRLRLRVALHRGLVKAAANGWVGVAAVAVHRILDSPPLREALAARPAVDFVLGLPDVLFQDVIAHATQPPLPADFAPVTVDLPAKDFVEHGWLYVGPGAAG
ncbi:hypothetical protein OOK41_25195 [Micromonospora sp. NBC_01655]|uniref:hypothetical protein n=1 Tax=Micromonospora sp. NBC_01655 TaxID=2975983 RepID=UPI002251592F|nr:hypothetical protein [Micromonospora sp. NBC_01655]MCX4473562.1 hypothetical protein [Micromonospora sp. NBC_01655]